MFNLKFIVKFFQTLKQIKNKFIICLHNHTYLAVPAIFCFFQAYTVKTLVYFSLTPQRNTVFSLRLIFFRKQLPDASFHCRFKVFWKMLDKIQHLFPHKIAFSANHTDLICFIKIILFKWRQFHKQ